MVWIIIESLAALLIAVFIVWWTMRPPKGRRGKAADAGQPRSHEHR